MTAAPIARCADCGIALFSPNEFLILVPAGAKGSLDIGGFDAFCERCFCAMGMSGGRKRWNQAMAPLTGRWVKPSGVPGLPWLSTDGWEWDPGEQPEFPDGVSLTYFDRPSITLFVFNKLGRCVMHTPASPREEKKRGRTK
ncbi:MAG: hypothetical protein ABUL62_06910 [Myxococcales bacterium]